jgi:hypothetical protein
MRKTGEARVSDENRIKAALYEAGRGGERGRAIFLKLRLTIGDENPEVGTMMMEEILPQMPEEDRRLVRFVLDELGRARSVTY